MITDSNNRFRVIFNFSVEIFFGVIILVPFSHRGEGRGHTLIWPERAFSAEQGMNFRVFCLTYGIQFQ